MKIVNENTKSVMGAKVSMRARVSMRAIFSGAACLFIFSGCQTVPYQGQAHDVKKRPQEEGVVGIPLPSRDEDRAKATERMQANCTPGQYKVIEEGEVAIGQEVKSSSQEDNRSNTQRQAGTLFGIPVMTGAAGGKDTSSSSVTTSVKEWQISYKCVGINSPAPSTSGGKKTSTTR